MARNRQRAKQRQQRRAAKRPAPDTQPGTGSTRHENVPGPLEHASGEVEEFDATLVTGADAETAEAAPATPPERREPAEAEPGDAGPPEPAERPEREPTRGAGRRPPPPPRPPTGGGDDDEPPDEEDESAAAAERALGRPDREPRREGNRVMAFLRASWAELQRVQWPDRRQVAQATAVVLGFVAIAGGSSASLISSRRA